MLTESPAQRVRRELWEAEWRAYEIERRRFLDARDATALEVATRNARGHGTHWKYKTGCRCDPCRMGYNAYQREYNLRKGIVQKRRAPRQHGINSTYSHGCRCDPCRAAGQRHRDEKRAAKT